MKIVLSIKVPDGISDSVRIAVDSSLDAIQGLSVSEKSVLFEKRFEETWDQLEKFITYQECMTIEIDTDTGVATVLPSSR